MVFYKQEQIMSSKRLEFHSTTAFLANAGGLFGLFMGASLLSFVELIYFLIFRLFYTKRTEAKLKIQAIKNETRVFTVLPRCK